MLMPGAPALIAFAFSMLGLALISSRVALAAGGVLVVWFYLEQLAPRSRRWQIVGWAALAVGAMAILYFSWDWFRSSTQWDLILKEMNSGWVQKIVREAGQFIRLPFMVGYGLAQPVLPAAIAVPAIPLVENYHCAARPGMVSTGAAFDLCFLHRLEGALKGPAHSDLAGSAGICLVDHLISAGGW
jgi:hypothetical protein